MPTTRKHRFSDLDEATKAEFGVETASGLVNLYDGWASRNGKRPLAEGSYPTSIGRTKRLLAVLRTVLRREREGK